MTTIHAVTVDQVLSATVLPKVACNNQNTVRLHVGFDSKWDGYAKSAIFYTSKNPTPYEVVFSSDNICLVPPEVLTETGHLFIGVKGVDGSAVKMSTVLKYKIEVGTPSVVISDPTGDVYHQLLESVQNTNARLSNAMSAITTDTEVIDIREAYNGEVHPTAGDAVRSQGETFLSGLTSESPCDCLKIRRAYYYLGKTSIDTNAVDRCKMRSSIVDLAAYRSAFATYGTAGGSPCAVVGELNNPIPVSTDLSGYALVVKTDYDGSVALRFSSGLSWAATETTTGLHTQLKKGVNIIRFGTQTVSNSGHAAFKYVSLQTEALVKATEFKAFIITDKTLLDDFTDKIEDVKRNMVYIDLDKETLDTYTKDIECSAKYEDSLLSINIAERTTAEAEWRFAITTFNLGKDLAGRKLLVRRNTNNMRSFGIGVSTSRWAEKNFSTDHDLHEIDLEEFIADNETLANNTGNYYLVIGIEVANTSTYNREYNESVNVMEITGARNSISPIARLATFDPDKYEPKTDYIVCWGDSLTAGGGWTERLATLSGLTVHNAGTGGENARTITARQGADVIMVNNFVIPANISPVRVAAWGDPFTTAFGHAATPLMQGGSYHVNPVKIGNIEGTLTWTGSSYNDTTGTWTFTRSVAGEETVIDRPTALTTAYDREKNNPHLMIIFMGQNGGYDTDNEELARLHRLMKEHARARHTIVLGLSSGSASSRANYEAIMTREFGRYFISLRDYLSKYGLADAGLKPTAEDTAAMNIGQVPPQLLSDAVHYTSACKTVIGNMIYKKCCELGIFE